MKGGEKYIRGVISQESSILKKTSAFLSFWGAGRGVVLAGIILAGGLSARFGADKYLWRIGGNPVITRVSNALEKICDIIILSARNNKRGLMLVEEAGISEKVLVVEDVDAGCGGPVKGVASVLYSVKADEYLVVSGDHPWIRGETLRRLVKEVREMGADVGSVVWGNGWTTPTISYLKSTMREIVPALCRIRGFYARATDILRAAPRLSLIHAARLAAEPRELIGINLPQDLRSPPTPPLTGPVKGDILIENSAALFTEAAQQEAWNPARAYTLYQEEAEKYLEKKALHLALHALTDAKRNSQTQNTEIEKTVNQILKILKSIPGT